MPVRASPGTKIVERWATGGAVSILRVGEWPGEGSAIFALEQKPHVEQPFQAADKLESLFHVSILP